MESRALRQSHGVPHRHSLRSIRRASRVGRSHSDNALAGEEGGQQK